MRTKSYSSFVVVLVPRMFGLEWSRFCGRTVCLGRSKRSATGSGQHTSRPTQTVPYGTDCFLNAFQAINCLATITGSLRDNQLVRRVYTFSTPLFPIEDEDDEYEDDFFSLHRESAVNR